MLLSGNNLYKCLKENSNFFYPLVKYNIKSDTILGLDLTDKNKVLQNLDTSDTEKFCHYINGLLKKTNAKFGIGGYDELRAFYSRSQLFTNENSLQEEPRRLHLGIDIWGKAGTEIFAPLDGIIHSFAFNNHFGDYGATIILQHQIQEVSFFTLYGHLSLDDLQNIKAGDSIKRGQQFAHFGKPEENGNWPPHLHFQVIHDIGNYKGDYPGVCKFSERKIYLENCPDPDLILNMLKDKAR